MKRSSTPFHPLRSSGQESPLGEAFGKWVGLGIIALLFSGCVTQGTYDSMMGERDQLVEEQLRLEQRISLLEASNESLGAERVDLLEQMENLREARTVLEADIHKLQRTEELLTTNLRNRDAELAATSEALRARESDVRRLHATYEGLVEDLESEVASGAIEIERLKGGLRVNLTQEVLFPSGSSTVNPAGRAVLAKVAARLRDSSQGIEVQGHTDDVPIRANSGSRFETNWDLASARATSVVLIMADQGVAPGRLGVASFGEYRPIASNESASGRAKNRRIEIHLKPEDAGELDDSAAVPAVSAAEAVPAP